MCRLLHFRHKCVRCGADTNGRCSSVSCIRSWIFESIDQLSKVTPHSLTIVVETIITDGSHYRCMKLFSHAPTTTLGERRKLEFLYVVLEVHMKIFRPWAWLVIFPILVNFGCGALICLYIPIKHPEVPLILSACFLLVAVIILGVIFWTSYDAVLVIRGTEELLGKLRTFHDRRSDASCRSETLRQQLLKRAKACRPVEIPVGSYGEFSLDVPVIMWDEILNQLLFLLSL